MTTLTPKREIDALLSRLIAVGNSDSTPNSDELERLQWQARKLLRSDPANAHMALGIMASWRRDEATAEQEFLRSRDTGGWRPDWALNFATTLGRFHRVEEALKQALDVAQQGPGLFYVPALREAISWAHGVGRLHRATELLESLRKHTTEPLPDKIAPLGNILQPLVEAADALGLTDKQMAAMQAPVWALLREKQIAAGAVGIEDEVYNDGSLFISRTFELPLPFEEILRLEEALVKTQSEQEETLPIWDFSVSLREQEAA
ncbi:MAG: hypothetical protein RKO66_12455 [Candidatus Contendobacter sp.]|nr:hypothetical protein [Candidatus Contendobacter sp.]MDS4060098.1 hypothetical protein [Candidatus Contendobacter sp.]